MRSPSLSLRVFAAVLAVSVASVLAVALVARRAFTHQLALFISQLPVPRAGMGRGRLMLFDAAERSLVSGVNRGVVVGGLIALLIAAVSAYFLGRYLGRPLQELEAAAEVVAQGDLTHRVEVSGPPEAVAVAEAFNRMAESLQHGETLRRRMVADVAHELRNPLAALRAQVEGVAEGVLLPDQPRMESIADDVRHLSALVDDLQELSLAEAGRLRYTMAEVDLSEVAAREVQRAATLATRQTEVTQLPVAGPAMVLGDELRLSQVVRNLLSNAVRHTSAGSVTVSISDCGDVVEMAVTDTGEGIPPEDLPSVFDRFYRVDSARAAATGGAGLGLAIVKRIVEDHGGTVFAESEPGRGSRIGFRLPRA